MAQFLVLRSMAVMNDQAASIDVLNTPNKIPTPVSSPKLLRTSSRIASQSQQKHNKKPIPSSRVQIRQYLLKKGSLARNTSRYALGSRIAHAPIQVNASVMSLTHVSSLWILLKYVLIFTEVAVFELWHGNEILAFCKILFWTSPKVRIAEYIVIIAPP
ncbi:hypothetical protein BGX26_010949 [Mortierella sp. AD094]|nr:hypothetical protein BGX26_010949 [Mortierella sp. AD094]